MSLQIPNYSIFTETSAFRTRNDHVSILSPPMPNNRVSKVQLGLAAFTIVAENPHTVEVSAGHELVINALHFSASSGVLKIRKGSQPYVVLFSTKKSEASGVFAGPLLLQGPEAVTFHATSDCDVVGSCVDIKGGELVQDFDEVGGADDVVVDSGAVNQQGGEDEDDGDDKVRSGGSDTSSLTTARFARLAALLTSPLSLTFAGLCQSVRPPLPSPCREAHQGGEEEDEEEEEGGGQEEGEGAASGA